MIPLDGWLPDTLMRLWRDIWYGPGSPDRRKRIRRAARARKARRGWR